MKNKHITYLTITRLSSTFCVSDSKKYVHISFVMITNKVPVEVEEEHPNKDKVVVYLEQCKQQ